MKHPAKGPPGTVKKVCLDTSLGDYFCASAFIFTSPAWGMKLPISTFYRWGKEAPRWPCDLEKVMQILHESWGLEQDLKLSFLSGHPTLIASPSVGVSFRQIKQSPPSTWYVLKCKDSLSAIWVLASPKVGDFTGTSHWERGWGFSEVTMAFSPGTSLCLARRDLSPLPSSVSWGHNIPLLRDDSWSHASLYEVIGPSPVDEGIWEGKGLFRVDRHFQGQISTKASFHIYNSLFVRPPRHSETQDLLIFPAVHPAGSCTGSPSGLCSLYGSGHAGLALLLLKPPGIKLLWFCCHSPSEWVELGQEVGAKLCRPWEVWACSVELVES